MNQNDKNKRKDNTTVQKNVITALSSACRQPRPLAADRMS